MFRISLKNQNNRNLSELCKIGQESKNLEFRDMNEC